MSAFCFAVSNAMAPLMETCGELDGRNKMIKEMRRRYIADREANQDNAAVQALGEEKPYTITQQAVGHLRHRQLAHSTASRSSLNSPAFDGQTDCVHSFKHSAWIGLPQQRQCIVAPPRSPHCRQGAFVTQFTPLQAAVTHSWCSCREFHESRLT